MNCECKWNQDWPGGIHQCAEHGRWARALLKEQKERDAKIAEGIDSLEYRDAGPGAGAMVAKKIRSS